MLARERLGCTSFACDPTFIGTIHTVPAALDRQPLQIGQAFDECALHIIVIAETKNLSTLLGRKVRPRYRLLCLVLLVAIDRGRTRDEPRVVLPLCHALRYRFDYLGTRISVGLWQTDTDDT